MARVIALALAGLGFALLAAEAVARRYLGPDFVPGAWVGPARAVCCRFDPELGWANRPGRYRIAGPANAQGERESYTATINSLGARGPERPHAKSVGVWRVLLLGDSTTWGEGVDDHEVFGALVERALAPGVEVVNLAVPGYSTDQELLILERVGARYAPDLVLLGLALDDLEANDARRSGDSPRPFFDLAEDGALVLTGTPLAAPEEGSGPRVKRALRRASLWSALVRLGLPSPRSERSDGVPKAPGGVDADWDSLVDPGSRSDRLLAALRARCAELGAPLHAFSIPSRQDRWLIDPRTPPPDDLLASGAALSRGSARLAEAGARLGITAVAVDRALLEETRAGHLLQRGDGHLNARGHRAVARALVDHLRGTSPAAR